MKKEIIINTRALVKSELPVDYYFTLQILFEKAENLYEAYMKAYPADFLHTLETLVRLEYLKYLGDNLDKDFKIPENIDILDFSLLPKATELFASDKNTVKISDVDNWIQEYRLKFKGIKPNSMGDPKACRSKMKAFLKANPQYTKEDIFKAVDNHIDETDPIYTMQADYFISKTGIDKIPVSKLFMYCERNELGESEDDRHSLNKMV